jgi:hypothetical protein
MTATVKTPAAVRKSGCTGAGALLVLCELEEGAPVAELDVMLLVLLLAELPVELEAVALPADEDEPSTASLVSDVDAAADPQATFAHRLSSDVLDESSGCETPSVQSTTGFVSISHSQHGSPSSWPFVWPSPSVSASQSSLVHLLPASEKASPNAFVAASSPVPSGCPIAGTSGTLPPLGSIATNSNEASAVGASTAAPANAERKQRVLGVVIFIVGGVEGGGRRARFGSKTF